MKLPKFKSQNLFNQVFTHRSYLNEVEEKIESNERIEFLGDSILSFVVSSYIFNRYKKLNEGELTNIRSVLTNTETFYNIAKTLELGKMLKLSRGEEQSGGRENKTILANTFEAFVGGLYLDQGLAPTSDFIEKALLAHCDELIKVQGLKDPKSKLQEKLQEIHKTSPVYKIIREEGPDHDKVYTMGVYIGQKILAEGFGKSKQEAEKEAARQALHNLS